MALLGVWEKLGGQRGRVSALDLKVAMLAIIGLFQPWMECLNS